MKKWHIFWEINGKALKLDMNAEVWLESVMHALLESLVLAINDINQAMLFLRTAASCLTNERLTVGEVRAWTRDCCILHYTARWLDFHKTPSAPPLTARDDHAGAIYAPSQCFLTYCHTHSPHDLATKHGNRSYFPHCDLKGGTPILWWMCIE